MIGALLCADSLGKSDSTELRKLEARRNFVFCLGLEHIFHFLHAESWRSPVESEGLDVANCIVEYKPGRCHPGTSLPSSLHPAGHGLWTRASRQKGFGERNLHAGQGLRRAGCVQT